MSLEAFYRSTLRDGDLAFDVGANLGDHTAAMLNAGARVVALEPQADLAQELVRGYPSVEVLALGASDVAGEGVLTIPDEYSVLATLNPEWATIKRPEMGEITWRRRATIQLTTLDDVISRFGVPAFVKIDTEGFDDRVLAGLSEPIEQLLFEVASERSDIATRALERLVSLGRYEYRLMEGESWRFGKRADSKSILRSLPFWGNVYARRRHPLRPGRRGRRRRSRI